MSRRLNQTAIEHYQAQGYYAPVPVLSAAEVAQYRAELEAHEAALGRRLDFPQISKSYLLYGWADALVHHPAVLDAVEDLIGPDILVYHSTAWIKEPGTPAFVHWHQDGKYFFLKPALHVTAWVALTDAGEESGCVRVLPGSHTWGEFEHRDDPGPWNMIKRGQGILDRFDDGDGVLVPLRAGEMSLHHTNLVHSSRGNNGGDRRIGLGISYIPTRVSQTGSPRTSALLVRGEDRYGHFKPEVRLQRENSAEAKAAHGEACALFRARQDQGAALAETA